MFALAHLAFSLVLGSPLAMPTAPSSATAPVRAGQASGTFGQSAHHAEASEVASVTEPLHEATVRAVRISGAERRDYLEYSSRYYRQAPDGAPVVYDRQQEIRQLLIDELRRRHIIRQSDYFVQNWSILPLRSAR